MAVQLPARYKAARQMLAECVRVDEIQTIRKKAIAMKVYAMQIKDPELIGNSVYVRKRAERRIGELMEEERLAGNLARSAGPGRGKKGRKGGLSKNPTLLDRGIDKNLANRARKAAAMPEDKYEDATNKAIMIAVAAATDDRAVISAARAERHKVKRKRREDREKALAEKLLDLPTKKYGVILADPEWRFEFWSEKGKDNSSADNHYETSALDVIKRRKVGDIAADDCVLFI